METNMKNDGQFVHIELYETHWTPRYSDIILFDIDNLILNYNGKNYFLKLNSILGRKQL